MDQNMNDSNHPKFWKRKKFWGIVVILAILVLIFCHHDNDYRGEADNTHTIAVAGHGEVFAAPDVASFSFSARGQAITVSDAQNKMTTVANAAIDFLKKNGVEAKDIQTTDYNVNPTYEYNNVVCSPYSPCPPGNPTITGYEVVETVTVKVRDVSKSGELLSGTGSLGVFNISSLSFTIDNPDSLKQQARKMAIDKAKAEANQLAKDLGVHLKKIVSFTESENYPGPIPYAARETLMADSKGGVAAPTIETGQNKITSDVTITYEIR